MSILQTSQFSTFNSGLSARIVIERMGEGEHGMIVAHRQEFGAAIQQPLTALTTGAAGAHAVTAPVVKHAGNVAVGAPLHVASKRVGVTVLDHLHRMTHMVGERRPLLIRRIVRFDQVDEPIGRRFDHLAEKARAAQRGDVGQIGWDDDASRVSHGRLRKRIQDESRTGPREMV